PSSGGEFTLYDNNNTAERMRIDSSGNVGIGTSSPSAPLTIKAPSNAEAIHVIGRSDDIGQIIFVEADGTTKNARIDARNTHLNIGTITSLPLKFETNATERMRIDSSGNVGIGNTAPARELHIGAADNTNHDALIRLNNGGATGARAGIEWYYEAGSTAAARISVNASNQILEFDTAGSEAMRIDSSGNLLVGTTGQLGSGSYGLHEIRGDNSSGGRAILLVYNSNAADAAPAVNAIKNSATTTSSQRFMQFYCNAGSTAMGGIVGNGASNVQFASISDAREKTNIQSISGSLDKINALNPVEFDWVASGEHVKAGFVAQEVEQVFPEFVVENMAIEAQEARKGITGGMSGGIIAHLVKAIQEQQATIKELEARITALENA
ncbi:MAG: tail fiber domain-containing protein, partial [Alphaproteobacteria bacterium]